MSDEEINEEEATPIEVKIVNETKKETTPYDEKESDEYIDHNITEKEIEEFENGDT